MNIQAPQLSSAPKALIYCRVSDKRQKTKGSGLESQEYRCREYATAQGYEVEAVFPDDVNGGGDFIKRAGMVALLAYLDAQHDKKYVVIFDDLKRFARDTEFHIKLRREFTLRKAKVECLNFKFEDTPEGRFIETILAAQGELEREQNGRQVVQKMKARLEQGYWTFRAPVGYKFTKSNNGGKELIFDEPLASIVKEALEGYAAGRYETQADVVRFLESQPCYPKDLPNGKIRYNRIANLLRKTIYAGYVEAPNWNISLRKGNHDAIISMQTYEKIQARLKRDANAPARPDINQDFPLRGFVLCNDCDKPLTACWSRGKLRKYAYYLCYSKGCDSYRKSIPRDKIEKEFSDIVLSLQPKENLFNIAKAMFNDIWNHRQSQTSEIRNEVKQNIIEIDKKITQLLDRLVDATTVSVIAAYENRIADLEKQKLIFIEKQQNIGNPKYTFDELFEHACNFLSNPYKLWASGQYNLKRMVLRLAFIERIHYCRKTGFRTPDLSLPFKVLASINSGKKEMVHRGEFESPTP